MAYPTVAFRLISPMLGAQPISEASTTQRHVLGQSVRAFDATYGEAAFVYLVGAASTAAGDVVTYNTKTGATVRAGHAVSGATGAAAVAMSACGASSYGWYAVQGSVPVNTGTVAANADLYLTSTAGQLDDVVVVGDQVENLTARAADSGGFATCQLAYPSITSDSSQSARFTGSKTHDWASINSGAQATTTVTVTGAALGMYARASMSVDLQAMQLTAYVSAADTVTCVMKNDSGGAVDLASATLRAEAYGP